MDQEEINSWIETLHSEIKEMRMLQVIFNEMRRIIVGNYTINIPNPFYGWMRIAYADAVSLAIRRQIDTDRRSISVIRLIQQAKTIFHDIDSSTSENEISHLLSKTELIRHYTNKRIAHLSKVHDATIPTWENVDIAIDIIDTLFKRYARLLTGKELDTTPPVADDWKAIFYTPWLGDNLQHTQRCH